MDVSLGKIDKAEINNFETLVTRATSYDRITEFTSKQQTQSSTRKKVTRGKYFFHLCQTHYNVIGAWVWNESLLCKL